MDEFASNEAASKLIHIVLRSERGMRSAKHARFFFSLEGGGGCAMPHENQK